jgi:amidase
MPGMISRRRFIEASALTGVQLAAVGYASQANALPTSQTYGVDSFELDELTVNDLRNGLESGRWTAQQLTALYLDRIDLLDRQGPKLGTIIETNPDAEDIALELDQERARGRSRGPLHGIPVVVKDNIATADRMTTTCGSFALEGSIPSQDAHLITRLREAGAIIMAKTNLSEWANFRDTNSTSGWSARGGQCRNPYVLDQNPCGSSSGSAVAVSANLASLAVGTETDGSIVCPASKNGVVGVKPTVGLISRRGIIPISASQDTAGPMTRTVYDAALLLGVMAGPDPDDPSTLVGARNPGTEDYTRFLDPDGLRGARLGVARNFEFDAPIWESFESSLDVFRDLGAEVIDPANIPNTDRFRQTELKVLLCEFKAGINAYLGGLGDQTQVHNLTELIAFNEANVEREMPYFGQDTFRAASVQGPLTDIVYIEALEQNRRYSRRDGIDAVMDQFDLDALIAPTGGMPWPTDYETGDQYTGGSSRPAAVAGYPNITVPMGQQSELPLAISFFGRAWSEPVLLRLAFAFEQATNYRKPPGFLSSSPL